jgi:hypothetical protein
MLQRWGPGGPQTAMRGWLNQHDLIQITNYQNASGSSELCREAFARHLPSPSSGVGLNPV